MTASVWFSAVRESEQLELALSRTTFNFDFDEKREFWKQFGRENKDTK